MTAIVDQRFDIAVVGGGPAGLIATYALAKLTSARIALVAPASEGDNRTSALMTPSIKMLEKLDLLAELLPLSAPLKIMRLVDDTGRLLRSPTLNFDAREVQDEAFGWNIPNKAIMQLIEQRLKTISNVTRFSQMADEIAVRKNDVFIKSGDESLQAHFVVGADGRGSPCRLAAGIEARFFNHPQVALTAYLNHEKPHNGISTEFHRSQGPFTLVPMPENTSSLVWVVRPEEAEKQLANSPAQQEAQIMKLSRGCLGAIKLSSPLQAFPLQSMQVSDHAKNRIFLIGEAAHVFPPIGAQGLNLTMRDVADVVDLFSVIDFNNPSDSADYMQGFNKSRKVDSWTRIFGVNLLNYSLILPYAPISFMRYAGMAALSNIGPLRRQAMRQGISPSKLPALMQ
jgi:2-octaprenyl-6-methoxyphenol hydroxylase